MRNINDRVNPESGLDKIGKSSHTAHGETLSYVKSRRDISYSLTMTEA